MRKLIAPDEVDANVANGGMNEDNGNDEPEGKLDVNAQNGCKHTDPRTGKYDLRARKPRDYGHMHATLGINRHDSTQRATRVSNFSVRLVLIAVMKELVQLARARSVGTKIAYS